jgi:putative transposase
MMVVMVIAAKSSAARYGPGRLVVDGTDETLRRKTTFACHPTAAQADALHGLLGVCCEVYNAALAERRDAWRSAGVKVVSLFEQFGQLTELRGVRDDVFVWGVQPLRGALRRLDEAYGAFLRRCAAGQTPGLPRFRSRRRLSQNPGGGGGGRGFLLEVRSWVPSPRRPQRCVGRGLRAR